MQVKAMYEFTLLTNGGGFFLLSEKAGASSVATFKPINHSLLLINQQMTQLSDQPMPLMLQLPIETMTVCRLYKIHFQDLLRNYCNLQKAMV